MLQAKLLYTHRLCRVWVCRGVMAVKCLIDAQGGRALVIDGLMGVL